MGTAQHRLGGLAHDALHHLMFKNRYLNELISDWFCMFPIYFYNPNEGKTYLMPWAIHLMKNREYQKVAQILAHERAISELITAT
jgi:hypothetical protein